MADSQDIELVYDDKCPVCRAYCRHVRLADDARRLVLVDARKPGPTVDALAARGLDINEGMAVTIDGTLHYGSEAIHQLTLLAEAKDPFGRLNRLFFGSRRLSRVSYAVGKAVRNLLLRLLGIDRIRHAPPPPAAGRAGGTDRAPPARRCVDQSRD